MKKSFIEFPVMCEYNCPLIDVSKLPMGPYICYKKICDKKVVVATGMTNLSV